MNVPFQIAIQYHEILITLLVAFILFISGVYLSEKIKVQVNKKAIKYGSPEVCGSCIAMIEVKKIPKIEKNQEDIRAPGGMLSKLESTMATLCSSNESLEKRVTKLFEMIEGDWQEKIHRLEVKLEAKDQQIRRLEGKG